MKHADVRPDVRGESFALEMAEGPCALIQQTQETLMPGMAAAVYKGVAVAFLRQRRIEIRRHMIHVY